MRTKLRTRAAAAVVAILLGGLLALFATSGPAVAFFSGGLFLDVQVGSPAHLVARGAAVDVPVEVTCNATGTADVFVRVTQKSGSGVAQGFGSTSVGCTGSGQQITIRAQQREARPSSRAPRWPPPRSSAATGSPAAARQTARSSKSKSDAPPPSHGDAATVATWPRRHPLGGRRRCPVRGRPRTDSAVVLPNRSAPSRTDPDQPGWRGAPSPCLSRESLAQTNHPGRTWTGRTRLKTGSPKWRVGLRSST